MSTTRIMSGLADLTGRQFGTLKVDGITARRPQPRYRTTCTRCGTQSTELHYRLVNGLARCQFSNCGKPSLQRGRDLLSEQRQQIAERENQRRTEEREASALRMEAEVGDWERPTRYTPTPSPYQPMSERERLSLREQREQEEAEQRVADAPRVEAECKAREARYAAETAQRERAEKQRRYWAEWVQNDKDPHLFVSDEMRNAQMTTNDAEAFTKKAAEKFARSPAYAFYRTPENADKILDYLQINGVNIADEATIRAAFNRLRDLGLLAAMPMPETSDAPDRTAMHPESTKRKEPSGPKIYRGRDYATGHEREFTEREVNRMSSLEYKRAFQIAPTVSELFTQMSDAR